jgi:hypothetical protein
VEHIHPRTRIQIGNVENKLSVALLKPCKAESLARGFNKRNCKQIFHGNGIFAVAVKERIRNIVGILLGAYGCYVLILLYALSGGGDIALGDIGIHLDINGAFGFLFYLLASFLQYRLGKELHIKIVSDSIKVTVLFGTEHIAGTAYLKVTESNAEARAELCVFPYRVQALFGNFGKRLALTEGEVRKRASAGATYAAA